MAQSLSLSVFVLVLAFCTPWTQGSDGGAQDCCLKYSLGKIPAQVVRGHRKQEPGLGGPMPAILFSPRRRSQAEPRADPEKAWGRQLMQGPDKPPAPRKQVPGCKKDKGTPKSGKKGKGSKGCESPQSSLLHSQD